MSLLWRRRSDLHPDQIRAIEGLTIDGKYLLVGPPGSGKTSILLHRGQYLRLPPHNLTNVRLVTFARTLREFIAVNGDERFPPNLIQTVHGFVDDLFGVYASPKPKFPDGTTLSEKNRLRAIEATNLIEQQGRKLFFDALLIDEVQDLSAEEVGLFQRLSDRHMMVGDSRQRLFDPLGGLDAAEQGAELITLRHHFRISLEICRVADAILRQDDYGLAEYSHYQGPPPSLPISLGKLTRAQQLERLIQALDLQLDTYNDPSDFIGVVASRTELCDSIFDALSSTKFAPMVRVYHSGIEGRTFDPGCRVCVTTIQSCKGLEFRALHWLFADEDAHHMTREKAYTVVTRAKSSLTVYHQSNLPACLAGAFPPPPQPLFEDDE
jgi:DNA helicase IV